MCKLEKALNGLCVSPKKYHRISETMKKMNFVKYYFQSCLFLWCKIDKILIVLLYVDNILLTRNCRDKLIETKQLKKEFK